MQARFTPQFYNPILHPDLHYKARSRQWGKAYKNNQNALALLDTDFAARHDVRAFFPCIFPAFLTAFTH